MALNFIDLGKFIRKNTPPGYDIPKNTMYDLKAAYTIKNTYDSSSLKVNGKYENKGFNPYQK